MQNNPKVLMLFGECVNSMVDAFPDDEFMEYYHSPQIVDLYTQYLAHVEEKNENNFTFSFWSSFIEMVQLLLLFTCHTRADDWHLHLSAIRSMLPWFFAYDRVNYQCYLTAYWLEMNLLEHTHPGRTVMMSCLIVLLLVKYILKCHELNKLFEHCFDCQIKIVY